MVGMGAGLTVVYLWKILFAREWLQIDRGIQFAQLDKRRYCGTTESSYPIFAAELCGKKIGRRYSYVLFPLQ